MQDDVADHQETTTKDTKAHSITPKRENVEAKGAKDGRAGHFDIETVFLVDETEVPDLVHNQAFETVVKDGELRRKKRVSMCRHGEKREKGIKGNG